MSESITELKDVELVRYVPVDETTDRYPLLILRVKYNMIHKCLLIREVKKTASTDDIELLTPEELLIRIIDASDGAIELLDTTSPLSKWCAITIKDLVRNIDHEYFIHEIVSKILRLSGIIVGRFRCDPRVNEFTGEVFSSYRLFGCKRLPTKKNNLLTNKVFEVSELEIPVETLRLSNDIEVKFLNQEFKGISKVVVELLFKVNREDGSVFDTLKFGIIVNPFQSNSGLLRVSAIENLLNEDTSLASKVRILESLTIGVLNSAELPLDYWNQDCSTRNLHKTVVDNVAEYLLNYISENTHRLDTKYPYKNDLIKEILGMYQNNILK